MSRTERLLQAEELLEAGQIDEARKLYEEASRDPETAAAALVGLARAALLSEDLDSARDLLQQARDLDPKDPEALTCQGLLYERDGDRARALECYRQAVELDARSPTTRLYYGRALLEEGNPTLAEVQLQAVVHLRPDDPLGYYLLGCAFLNNGRRADAALRMSRAIEVDPDFAEAYEALGELLLELGRIEEARKILREGVLRLDEAGALACLRLLAPAAASAEDFEAAIRFLSSRARNDPESGKLCSELCRRVGSSGLPEPEPLLQRLVELCPDSAGVHLHRGVVLEERGQTVAAIEAYTRAHQLEPGDWETACRLGRLLIEESPLRNEEEGLRLLKLATELAGSDPRPFLHLAQGYVKVGRPDRARRAALKVARNAEAPEALQEQARDLLRRLPVR